MLNKQKEPGSKFTKFDMLDEEKFNSFMRVMAKLQAEGKQVESSKKTIGHLVKELDSAKGKAAGIGKSEALPQAYEARVKELQPHIEGALKYLLVNQEALDKTQQEFL